MINLPFLAKSNKADGRFLVANINSDYVRCLVLYKEGDLTKILGVGKQELDPGKVRAGSIIYSDYVAQALETAAQKALEEVGGEISDVVFGVSGDLCLGLMTTIKAKRNRPAAITNQEIRDLTDKINESAYLQAQNEYMEINGSSENDLDTVTSSNVYLKLDNQKTPSLENKTGAVIEMAVFNAFVPKYHISALQDVAKGAGLKIMAIGSEMYCLVQTILSSKQEPESDFIVVEIDGDYTTAAVVFGKGIVGTRTLNVGYRHFVEGLSERMGITMHEAERMLKTYVQGKLTSSESTIVQNALRNPIEIWLSGMELLFAEYSGVKTFAPRIYFTGEGADVPDLWNLLTTKEWTKSIPFKASPEFKKLNFIDVNSVSDSTGKVASSEWIPTACLAMIKLELDKEND